MGRKWQLVCSVICMISLSACTNSNGYVAPSINANLIDTHPQGQKVQSNLPFLPDHYVVEHSGESIYNIAARYAVNASDLIRVNHLQSPYNLHQGEVINFRALETRRTDPSKNMVIVPIKEIKPIIVYKPPHYRHKAVAWLWPIKKATVKQHFSQRHQGLDLAVSKPAMVRASKAGKVIFINKNSPTVVIVKHAQDYMSAYGHLAKIRVHTNQYVKQGAIIGQFVPGKKYRTFYFELRHRGIAVDPLRYLSTPS